MTLHLLFSCRLATHQRLLQSLKDGDVVMLLEQALMQSLEPGVRYLARLHDGQQQGLQSRPVQWINDEQWLQLTLDAARTLSWFD